MKKIGFAITSSYCTVDKVLGQMEALVEAGYDVIPIASQSVIECDTRFGKGSDFKEKIEFITGHKIVTTIIEAEKFGPKEPLDLLLIAPATGNFIGKLANGITDNVVTMTAKATLRNQKPLVIGISTNDGLGLNGENIMRLLNQKGIYFIPFGQDDYTNKPNSLIAHYDLSIPTIESAFNNNQYQPVLKEHQKTKTK
jgi:dipicolinate synthase subunit B